MTSIHTLSLLLVLLTCFCQNVPAKNVPVKNLQDDTEASLPQSRQRRATRIAEFELETLRQHNIAKLLRKLYIQERMRQLTAKRSAPVASRPIKDYEAFVEPGYYGQMKRDLSQQYSDDSENEEVSQDYGDLVGALQKLVDGKVPESNGY